MNGIYGGWGILVVGVVLIFLALFDVIYLQIFLLFGFENSDIFSAILINLLGLFLLALPCLGEKIDASGGSKISNFLDLPGESVRITFPVLSGFLGEQALGGFLGSVLILTTRQVFSSFGVIAAGIYCFVLAVLAMAIMSCSIIRFILLFARYGWRTYGAVSGFSLIVMFGFFWAGVESVS